MARRTEMPGHLRKNDMEKMRHVHVFIQKQNSAIAEGGKIFIHKENK
jgi:hypothetical protein